METLTETKPSIFLTDYASYNNGTQFEFGHWVDLTQFNDADELGEYITNHFKQADKDSPLDEFGSIREETMITDYEGLPASLYSESSMNFEKVFAYMEIAEQIDTDDYESLIQYHNQMSEGDKRVDEIYDFDDDFFDRHYFNDPIGAAQATFFGKMNWSDEYITFNGYGNLESIASEHLDRYIDKDSVIEWLIDNPQRI